MVPWYWLVFEAVIIGLVLYLQRDEAYDLGFRDGKATRRTYVYTPPRDAAPTD